MWSRLKQIQVQERPPLFNPDLLKSVMAGYSAALLTGRQFLWILSPFYLAVSAKLVADGILRGVSAMRQFMTAIFIDLILRVTLAFILSGLTKSAIGIWCTWPIGWTIAMVFSIFFYQREYRKLSNRR